jgi:hypothetical protein
LWFLKIVILVIVIVVFPITRLRYLVRYVHDSQRASYGQTFPIRVPGEEARRDVVQNAAGVDELF